MNPFKFIKAVIKDFIGDIKFIFKSFRSDKPMVDPEKWQAYKQDMKSMDIGGELMKSWYWILAVVFALMIGLLISGKYYEMKCNNIIVENYINPEIDKLGPVSPFIPIDPEQQYEEGSDGQDKNEGYEVNPVG